MAEPGRRHGVMTLRAELRKACTVPIVALLVVGIGVLWQDLGRTTDFAAAQTPIAVASDAEITLEQQAACGDDPTSDACDLARQDDALNRWFAPNAYAAGQVAASLDTVPGLLTFVSHQAGSGLGLLLLAAFVGLHVSAEHAGRTIEGSVQRTGRAGFWAGKVASTVVVAAAAVVGATVVLYVLRPTFFEPVEVPVGTTGFAALDGPMRAVPPDPTWSSWGSAISTFAVALAVLAIASVGFVTVACLVRSAIGTTAILGGGVIGAFVLAGIPGLDAPLGHRALASALGLDDGRYGIVDARLLVVAGRPSRIYDHASAVPATGIGWIVLQLVAWGALIVVGRWAFLHRTHL